MLAYVYDEAVKREVNGEGQNCWEVYLREILGMLGASAKPISLSELNHPQSLEGIRTLIIGCQSGARLDDSVAGLLNHWVYAGGVLIGFQPQGLDALFGIKPIGEIPQATDDYEIVGQFELQVHPLTFDLHPILFSEQRLLIISDISLVGLNGAVEVGRLLDGGGKELSFPAVTWRAHGQGFAGYFAFDMAKTIWLLHQGRRLEPGVAFHAGQMTLVVNHSKKVPYADIMAFLLQNMISVRPQPFVFQLPPHGGTVPDALFYWTGDDYYGPVEFSLQASDFMKELGLPYHINVGSYHPDTGKGHPMSDEELKHIYDNGHEISLWFNMRNKNRSGLEITEERIKHQADLFEKRFGRRPESTLMTATNWYGWAEPARWMANHGVKADNSFGGNGLRPDHPLANDSNFIFGFGTSFPYYFYEDFTHGNERIDCMEQPIICYELGHRASTDRGMSGTLVRDELTFAPEDIHLPVDMAVKYHMTMDFFYHPYYIANFPNCRKAIKEIVDYAHYKQASILHMGNDQLCRWWNARTLSHVHITSEEDGETRMVAECPHESGMIVKLALSTARNVYAACDGQEAVSMVKWEFGRHWLFVIVPQGRHEVTIRK